MTSDHNPWLDIPNINYDTMWYKTLEDCIFSLKLSLSLSGIVSSKPETTSHYSTNRAEYSTCVAIQGRLRTGYVKGIITTHTLKVTRLLHGDI